MKKPKPSNSVAAYEQLSHRYRSSPKSPGVQNVAEAQAYVTARMPATRAVIAHLIEKIPDAPQSILDIGAGPGTASLACLEKWPDLTQLTLLENDPHMRQLQPSSLHTDSRVHCLTGDARTITYNSHDLVICAYMLNELSLKDQLFVVQKAWEATQQTLLVIVPGTPGNYKELMVTRDACLQMGAFILAPCPHEKKCPLQRDEEGQGDTWCRFVQRLPRTGEHKRLKKAALGYEDESFSYLLLSRTQLTSVEPRLIAEPEKHKGHIRARLCMPDGQIEFPVATASKNPMLFQQLKKKHWGDEV